MAKRTAVNRPPTPKMPNPIPFNICALTERGCSFMTVFVGGNDANANAAKVSMIKFTHNIWVTVNGDYATMNAPMTRIKQAATFTVIWKRMKRLMFL